MVRCLICILIPISIHAQDIIPISGRVYYGELKYPDRLYRVLLETEGQQDLRFYIIGFRPNEIPLKKIKGNNDSLTFERDDFFSAFRGKWTPDKKGISGIWIGEKKERYALHLKEALVDTLPGVLPRTNRIFNYKTPTGVAGIKTDHLASANINEKVIARLGQDIVDQRYGYLHSLLISRNDQLVVEEYFYNIHAKVSWGIQSVTKSLVSALAGIAIHRSELAGTNSTLCQTLKTHSALVCNEKNKGITIHELLSMSTGLAWDERTIDYGEAGNSNTDAFNEEDPFRYLFSRPMGEKRFSYNSMNHLVMNKILRGATRLSNKTEMKKRLIEPLGIVDYDLGKEEHGVLGDIFLTPREMMKFGTLYLNEGRYEEKQVIPADWIKVSTTRKVDVDNELGYGYFWWTTTFPWNGKVVESYFAWGYGGQYIIVVPELRVVVVLTGSNWSTDPKRNMMEIMRDYIIPACE